MSERFKKELIEWIKAFVIGIILFVIIRNFLFTSYLVSGGSMEPTLHDGDRVIVNRIGYIVGDIDRQDVIVFHFSEQEDYVKRVIGLPGDEIEYVNDVLYVNGEQVDENYLEIDNPNILQTGTFTLEGLTGKQTVPEGHLFVLGDNRDGSTDSREFGFIPMENVVGEVVLRFLPFDSFKYGF